MEILRQLSVLQHRQGYVDDDSLREMSRRLNVPLYRLEGLVSFYTHFRRSAPPRHTVTVCRDVICSMFGADALCERIQTVADAGSVAVEEVSCLGRCDSPPVVAVNDVPLPAHDQVFALIDGSGSLPENAPTDSPRTWLCDPYSSANEHYATAIQLCQSPDELVEACLGRLSESNLRGMGGAGFPTGRKWQMVASQPTHPKYVICNADESEPGTFKDRVILEELPHLMIEGMVLAGLVVGAEQGIVYLRHEYDRERQAVSRALDDARARGVLGDNAAGSGRPFDIEVFISPGGYILGEETALLEALEDRRGEPRNKPPYPGSHGLWGRPTLINNVETFALAASIVCRGPDWWHEQGHEEFSGLKFVCISGDIERPGVYEIPHGTPVLELIRSAGGMRDGLPLKAFLPGGASSKFLTAGHADTPLDFDAMQRAGSMLGTGAVIVIAEGRELFPLATNLVRFFRNESCGKCVPCRVGTEKAVGLLEQVRLGASPPSDLDVLDELGETLEQTSICGLGQVALNPILSMLRHFPDEVP